MFQSVPSAARAATLGLLLAGAAALPAQAQFSYLAGNASVTTSAYVALGATATAIPVANNDDANSVPQNIGFSFSYNGQAVTQFVFNTNGFIKLGSTAPSAADLYYTDPQAYTPTSAIESADPADINIIAPFNYDLEPGTGTVGFKKETTGAAPNRICIIEWANVSDKMLTVAKQLNNLSFQVKLYESSNRIEFVYGPSTAGGAPAFLGVPAGLTGTTPTTDVLVLTKGSSQAFTAATFQNAPYDATQNRLNVRSNIRPTPGVTYRFTATAANDVNVARIYSLGQLPIPFGAPHVASALIVNAGTNAVASLPVTLTVSGANTFTNTQTLTNVAPGDSILVTFGGYTPTAVGMNTLTVSVPADDNTGNDSNVWGQEVTNDTYRYADTAAASTSYGLNSAGLWLVKHTTSQPKALMSTSVLFGNDPGVVGKQYYGVMTDDQGVEIARSANYTATTADLNTYHVFNFATTPSVPVGDFYAGVGQVTGGGQFPISVQDEDPTRTGAYYIYIPGPMGGMIDVATEIPVRPMIAVTLGTPAACQAPSALMVTNATATSADVSFDPASGAQGYTIYYGPVGFTPGGSGSMSMTVTGTTATLSPLLASTNYEVYVRTNCSATVFSANAGPVAFTTTCASGTITTFPYTENFDATAAGDVPCGATIVNANNDGETWTVTASPFSRSGANALRYSYVSANGADDWFFTPALALTAGQQFNVSFWYRLTDPLYPEGMEVKYGTAPTVAAMTSAPIFSNASIGDTAYTMGSGRITAAAGTYYVGFHCISAADQFRLYLDDITVERVTGTRNAALARAVSVHPNPTTGRLNVSLTETGATKVALRVVDNLGRVVYTGSMSDNAVQNIDLSNLSNGLYTVQVTLDDQVVTKQVSVLK